LYDLAERRRSATVVKGLVYFIAGNSGQAQGSDEFKLLEMRQAEQTQ
jgi:hypothetical protein